MDFGVLVILAGILVGGFTLGMLASVAGPRDEEAAAMHRDLARRARAWRPGRLQSRQVRLQAKPRSAYHG